MWFGDVVLAVSSVAMLGGGLAQPAEAFAGKEPVKLTPHRAVYEVTLDDARSASGITGIDGRMVFEFSGSECDGYTLNMRMVTQMTDSPRPDQPDRSPVVDLGAGQWPEVPLPVGAISERQARRRDHGACDAQPPIPRSR